MNDIQNSQFLPLPHRRLRKLKKREGKRELRGIIKYASNHEVLILLFLHDFKKNKTRGVQIYDAFDTYSIFFFSDIYFFYNLKLYKKHLRLLNRLHPTACAEYYAWQKNKYK